MKTDAPTPFARLIDRLRETGGLKDTDIANFAGVSLPTVSGWKAARKAPHPKTQLLVSDLAWVVTRLGEHYCPDEIRAWFYARHPQLDGDRAIDLIQDDRTEEVLAILDRLDAETYL